MKITVYDNEDDIDFEFEGTEESLRQEIVNSFKLLSDEQFDTLIQSGWIDRGHVSANIITEDIWTY